MSSDSDNATTDKLSAVDIDTIQSRFVDLITHTRIAFISDKTIDDAEMTSTLQGTLSPVVESIGRIGEMTGLETASKIEQVVAHGMQYVLVMEHGLVALAKIVQVFRPDRELHEHVIKFVHDLYDTFNGQTVSSKVEVVNCELTSLACNVVLDCINCPILSPEAVVMALDTCRMALSCARINATRIGEQIVCAAKSEEAQAVVAKYIMDELKRIGTRSDDSIIWLLDVAQAFIKSRADASTRGVLLNMCSVLMHAIGEKSLLVDVGLARTLAALFSVLPASCTYYYELYIDILLKKSFAYQTPDGYSAVFLDALYAILCLPSAVLNMYEYHDCRMMHKPLLFLTTRLSCDAIAQLSSDDSRCMYSINYIRFVLDDIGRFLGGNAKSSSSSNLEWKRVEVLRKCATEFNESNEPRMQIFHGHLFAEDSPKGLAKLLHMVPWLSRTAIRKYLLWAVDNEPEVVNHYMLAFSMKKKPALEVLSELVWQTGVPHDVETIERLAELYGQAYFSQNGHGTEEPPITADHWTQFAKFAMLTDRYTAVNDGTLVVPEDFVFPTERDKYYYSAARACNTAMDKTKRSELWSLVNRTHGLIPHFPSPSTHSITHDTAVCTRRMALAQTTSVLFGVPEVRHCTPSRDAVISLCEKIIPQVMTAATRAFHTALTKDAADRLVQLLKTCVDLTSPDSVPDLFLEALCSEQHRGAKLADVLDFVAFVVGRRGNAIKRWGPVVATLCNACNTQTVLDRLAGKPFRRTRQPSFVAADGQTHPPASNETKNSPGMVGWFTTAIVTALKSADTYDDEDSDLVPDEMAFNVAAEEARVISEFDNVMDKIRGLDVPVVDVFVETCVDIVRNSPPQKINPHVVASALAIMSDAVVLSRVTRTAPVPWNVICDGIRLGVDMTIETVQHVACTCAVALCRVANNETPDIVLTMFREAVSNSAADGSLMPASPGTVLTALASLLGVQGMNLLATNNADEEISLFRDIAGNEGCGPATQSAQTIFAAIIQNSGTMSTTMFARCANALAAHWSQKLDAESLYTCVTAIGDFCVNNSDRLIPGGYTDHLVRRLTKTCRMQYENARTAALRALANIFVETDTSINANTALIVFVETVLHDIAQFGFANTEVTVIVDIAKFLTAATLRTANRVDGSDTKNIDTMLAQVLRMLLSMTRLQPNSDTGGPNNILDSILCEFLNAAMHTHTLLDVESTEPAMKKRWTVTWEQVRQTRDDIATDLIGSLDKDPSVGNVT